MTAHLTKLQEVDIVNAYSIDLIRMEDLSIQYNRTRQSIWKVLKKYGIDTAGAGSMDVSCYTCNKEFKKYRYQVRKNLHVFCSEECYFAFLEAGRGGAYAESRTGQRLGRYVVSQYFDLQPGNIVHHEDHNTCNNLPHNLKVFRNQGDHVRYHRGFDIKPIWDGIFDGNPHYMLNTRAMDE